MKDIELPKQLADFFVSRCGAAVVLEVLMRPALRAIPALSVVSDGELVARALTGDGWAQATIYQRYAPRLLNSAARLLGSREDAMDLVQEVFVDALDSLASLREPEALGAWLLRRAVNRATRRLKNRRWKRLFGLTHAQDMSLATLARGGCSPEVRAELERVAALLERLPPRQRVAWIMHKVEGETLPVVAQVTDTSLATVKRDIAAAEAVLSAQMKGAQE